MGKGGNSNERCTILVCYSAGPIINICMDILIIQRSCKLSYRLGSADNFDFWLDLRWGVNVAISLANPIKNVVYLKLRQS